MRSVTYSMGVSLDGYIVGAGGGLDWTAPDGEVFRFVTGEIRQVGVHGLGRLPCETMLYLETADQGPSLGDSMREWAAIWKRFPKVVFPTTLPAVQGNACLASGGVAEEIERLRAEPAEGHAAGQECGERFLVLAAVVGGLGHRRDLPSASSSSAAAGGHHRSPLQMTGGGARAEAAHYLGISDGDGSRPTEGRICSPAGIVHSRARQQTDPSGFEAGLRSLARELSDPDTPLVNYQRRRQALESWALDEPTWDDLTARLPPRSRARTPDLGDRRRQVASVYVWVRVTSGEPGFAPRPIEAAQRPDVRERWRRSWNFTWWTLLTRDNPHSGYRRLRAELEALAAVLAMTIDPSHPADSTLGRPASGTHPAA